MARWRRGAGGAGGRGGSGVALCAPSFLRSHENGAAAGGRGVFVFGAGAGGAELCFCASGAGSSGDCRETGSERRSEWAKSENEGGKEAPEQPDPPRVRTEIKKISLPADSDLERLVHESAPEILIAVAGD